MKKLMFVVAFLPNVVGCAEPTVKKFACPSLSGNYFSVGEINWIESRNSKTNILREVFKYSLPDNVGDPKKYETLLQMKYDWFNLDIRNDVFFFKLYDNQEIIYEFSFSAVCSSSGWQATRISKRYLDGNVVSSHFESTFSKNVNESLVVRTYVLSGNSKAEVRAEFPRRPTP